MASGRSAPKRNWLKDVFKAFRAKHFPTQQGLANVLECSASLISLYEQGDAVPPKWRLKELARQFPGLDPEREFFRAGHHR